MTSLQLSLTGTFTIKSLRYHFSPLLSLQSGLTNLWGLFATYLTPHVSVRLCVIMTDKKYIMSKDRLQGINHILLTLVIMYI